ncbi:Sec-independent protein translocase subunit TatA [Tomitella fengzijianii]|uniref:Sec-independent protein translocase protein TatA n=1 Tax=Tomitella fengzijianii TaxID=2597660 RepID=A0A516X2T9_9ACTN|nr:Sec-independent protein translocase subunit TatA [Tomitella fengzijianii]QDQ97375.1 Sec-independent protein translocase subunit TatA [Tomitella fengzijianii]
MGAMSPWHWAIVLIVLVLLFGSTRLPGAARGLGRSLRIFKSEMKEMTGNDSDSSESAPQTSTPQALPAQPAGTTPQAGTAPAATDTPQSAAAPQQTPPAPGTGA